MAGNLTHYAFDKVLVIVGPLPITGFHEGDEVIAVERAVPSFTLPVGAGGDAVAVLNSDRSGSIVLKLQLTSPSNSYLSGFLKAAESGIFAPIPVLIKDAGTLVQLVAAPLCVLEQPANQTYGSGHTVREWKLLAAGLEMIS